MKLPPDQVAATVEVPLNRSRTAMTLVPALPGLPWVAYQEIIVWVTSSGWKFPPLILNAVEHHHFLTLEHINGLTAIVNLADCIAHGPPSVCFS